MREETWKQKEAKMENEAAHGWGFEFCAAWGFAKLYGFPRRWPLPASKEPPP